MRKLAFNPAWGQGVILATSVASSRTEVGKGSFNIVVTNQDNNHGMYVRAGDNNVVATSADYYLPPNGQVALNKFKDFTHVAAIAVANTPNLHIIPGVGL